MPGVIVPAREFGLHGGGEVTHGGAPAERAQQRVVDRRPHPRHLLVGPSSGERPVGLPRRAVAADLRPHVVETVAGRRAARQHRRHPLRARRVEQVERRRRAPARATRASSRCSPSALFTATTSASSRTPLLMPCSSSPVPGQHQHAGTCRPCRRPRSPTGRRPTVSTSTTSKPAASHDHDRLARPPRDAAERARPWARAG